MYFLSVYKQNSPCIAVSYELVKPYMYKHLRSPRKFSASASRYKERVLLASNHYEPSKSEDYCRSSKLEKNSRISIWKTKVQNKQHQMVKQLGFILRWSHFRLAWILLSVRILDDFVHLILLSDVLYLFLCRLMAFKLLWINKLRN